MTAPGQGADISSRAAIIILNWRGADDTIACLQSALASDHPTFDVMVCDNDSGDGSLERLAVEVPGLVGEANTVRGDRGLAPFTLALLDATAAPPEVAEGVNRVWIIPTGRNGGYAFGNNVGIRLALLDSAVAYMWVLNNDTVVDPAALTRVTEYMERHPDIALCGMKVLYLDRPQEVQAMGGGRFLTTRTRCVQVGEGLAADAPVDAAAVEASLSYVNGAATVARRTFIDEVGLMDEGYFLYWEEMDWATRALRTKRWRLGLCVDAVAYHRVGASTGSNDHGLPSLSSTYWLTRSKFRYLRLHRPALLAIAAPLLAKAILTEAMARRWQRGWAMLMGALGLNLRV